MLDETKEEAAKQEIENWIEDHSFRGPSDKEARWLQNGLESGAFSEGNLIGACIYAYHQAEAAVKRNMRWRKDVKNEVLLHTSDEALNYFADVANGDLDPRLTMITTNNRVLAEYAVVKDPRHLRTIAAWAKIYHRASEENLKFRNTFRAIERTQEWFDSSDRARDRLGRRSNELDEPRIFTSIILKKLVFYGRNRAAEKLNEFIEKSTQTGIEFPSRIRIPNLNSRVFHVQPAANPDLYSLDADSILLLELEPEQEGDKEDEKKTKWVHRRQFFEALAILAWTMHEINAAATELGRSLRYMRAKHRRRYH